MIKGKNIVLTGCNSGIGLEVLKLLMDDNKVLCVDKDIDVLTTLKSENLIVMQKDVSSKEAVDEIFELAEKSFDFIDIFYANAGYPYYEEMNYVDWDRVQRMFETNVFSPIYSYQKYVEYLDGRRGNFAITISAIGQMAMPGFTIYSASKFAMEGYQQCIRFEKPHNVKLTCLYPVATDTNFFKAANEIEFKKPFPVQHPKVVARKMVAGIEKDKDTVSPCILFGISKQLMKFIPPVKTAYLALEKQKFKEFKAKVKEIKEFVER